MAESTPDERNEPGAPIARDAIDPDLIKLQRPRPKIGVITGLGVVLLCVVFLLRLNGDRKFSGDEQPTKVSVADIVAGKVDTESFVTFDAEPMMSHAIRASRTETGVGFRVVPVRGTGEKLWLVLHGDGWEPAKQNGYVGRLRPLSELPFEEAVHDYARTSPRPVFATAAATRAGFSTNKVTTVAGDTVTLTDKDQVAIDLMDPNVTMIVAALNQRLPSEAAWRSALTAAGVTPGPMLPAPNESSNQVRFEVAMPATELTAKLQAATLLAARVEPITRHYKTTWGALRASSSSGFSVTADGVTKTIPDAQLDLVGLYVNRSIPDGAYALITGERPQDYWYVLPIMIALVLIGLVFGWALIRAVKRDVLPPTTTA